ncbi:MAG: acetoin utilization protein AcuC [Roseiarcus sp.]
MFVGSELYRRAAYGRNHPLAIARVETTVDLCRTLGWLEGSWRTAPAATVRELESFHRADYIEALRSAELNGLTPVAARRTYRIGTIENPIFAGPFERACTSVGGPILAASLALEGRVAYHPAGGTHHGRPDRASGFCYFNDPVFAILKCLDEGLDRILYVDLDAHHGDGVEDAFAREEPVFTISIHEAGRWPFTGRFDDRRDGRARNLPVPPRLNDSEFAFLMSEAVLPLATRFRPQAVVVTCGADCLSGDPLSTMELSNVALWDAASRLADLCTAAIVLGGGGYNPWTVARAWAGLWGRLCDFRLPDILPGAAQQLMAGLTCDLVDDEDVKPEWIGTLADAPNPGPIRGEVQAIARHVLG